MNKHANDPFTAAADDGPLTREEVAQLREILKVVRYDAPSETLRIETGKAKILVRKNGDVRIDGRKITQMAQGRVIINGASVDLN